MALSMTSFPVIRLTVALASPDTGCPLNLHRMNGGGDPEAWQGNSMESPSRT